MSQLTFEDVHALQRLINAAEAVCTITANGELFAACDGAEPQRTTTVAALDELEHAHEAASAVLGSLILHNASPICDENGDVKGLQLPNNTPAKGFAFDPLVGPETTILRFGGHPLPKIGEQQSWCCDEGCGVCSPIQVDFEFSRTEDTDGNLIESRTQKVWRSDCCKAGLMLWDETAQDYVAWESK